MYEAALIWVYAQQVSSQISSQLRCNIKSIWILYNRNLRLIDRDRFPTDREPKERQRETKRVDTLVHDIRSHGVQRSCFCDISDHFFKH